MTCSDHDPQDIETRTTEGGRVELEATCTDCGTHLWASADLKSVTDVAVGDDFRGPDGIYWSIADTTRPGRSDQSGSRAENVNNPLEAQSIGVVMKSREEMYWFETSHFERVRKKLLTAIR